MARRKLTLLAAVFAIVILAADSAWALGLELSETKDQLGLKYDVSVTDHGTGRVTIELTLVDQGRLRPLDRGVDFVIPSKDGTGFVDLSMSMNRRVVEGTEVMSVHLQRDLAERAQIQLKTSTLDGKKSPRTWYYHVIPIAEHLKGAADKK